jgi:eukaryotic-like serine/threonine-protein kinase
MNEKDIQTDGSHFPFPEIKIPKNIGRFAIIEKLGRGSMGIVLKGWDPFIERYVAIKIPLPSEGLFETSRNKYDRDFFREAQTAGRLSHPNIVAVYDADISNNFCYLAMEYIDGPTLKRFCRKDNLLPAEKVVETLFHICRALDYAHSKDVVHWDIKPANIMLTRSGSVKVTDFSIARMSQNAIKTMAEETDFQFNGTLRYMSPEHFDMKDRIDPRLDIFSLGSLLYELLSGKPAFEGNNPYTVMYKISTDDPPSILRLRPELPEVLEKIIHKALKKEPRERYQSCMDFAYDLSVALRHMKRTNRKNNSENLEEYISNIPFFGNFSKTHLQKILLASQIVRTKRGEVAVTEGEIDDTLFIILSGGVEVLKGSIRIDTIERGECFGEMAYLSGQPRAASVKALTDCTLLKISASLVDRLPENIQILFLKSFAKTAVDRISKNHQLILNLSKQLTPSDTR